VTKEQSHFLLLNIMKEKQWREKALIFGQLVWHSTY